MISMSGKSFDGPLPPLTASEAELRDALRSHVRVLSVDIGERNVDHYEQLNAAGDYIERTVASYGYTVATQTFAAAGKQVRNIEVEVPGAGDRAKEIVIVGAHYDSVEACPAANDNGTGVAAALELARRFANSQTRCTIRFVFFVNEEPPFFQTESMGSLVYARRCRQRNDDVVAMLSLETIGYFSDDPGSQKYPAPFGMLYPSRGNFIAFVGNYSSRRLVRNVVASFRAHAKFPSEGGALPESISGIGWSDHWSFSQVGYPALMVTDTAPFRYPHYHTPQDTIDKINFDRITRVVMGVGSVIDELVNPK
jgi:Zn-dependent M28 family amino/carboxypeptidase